MLFRFEVKTVWWSAVIAFAALCVGRAWIIMSIENPLLEAFYNPLFAYPFVKNFSDLSWRQYLRSEEIYGQILHTLWSLGIVLIFFSLTPFWPARWKKSHFAAAAYYLTGVFCVLYAFFDMTGKGWATPIFFEHSLQFATPFLCWFFIRQDQKPGKSWHFWLKLSIAATFISHALYALNIYRTPGYYIDMTIKALHVNEDTARIILFGIGVLDIAASLSLFLKPGILRSSGIWYIIIWGAATATARIWTNYYASLGWSAIRDWIPEFLVRTPHFLWPFAWWISDRTTESR